MKTTLILKRIDPVKYAIISGILHTIFGLVFIPISFLIPYFMGINDLGINDLGINYPHPPNPFDFLSLGIMKTIILVPIFYGVFGFIFVLIGTFIFNWLLKLIKGLHIDVENFDIQIQKHD